jgi:hypothetical protein
VLHIFIIRILCGNIYISGLEGLMITDIGPFHKSGVSGYVYYLKTGCGARTCFHVEYALLPAINVLLWSENEEPV